jgi:3-hydroxymyristoyl/3-hydroxydecanoyl-(acyl carrier protein) dehydratase
MLHSEIDRIDPLHPALPGHFPGKPVVPGVLILARVFEAIKAAFGARASLITVAKFHARLEPAEEFRIDLERGDTDVVRFRVQRGETLIASGMLRLHPASPAGSGRLDRNE